VNFSALFIHRPVMTSLVMFGNVVFGVMAYTMLPMSDLPNVDFPTLQVTASLPGANPETMASSVATPLEREFSTIAGVDSMTSTNIQGSSQITLQFTLTRDIDAAAQDVQAAIARSQTRLPHDMPAPPSYKKVNPADQPILYLALTSPTLPLYDLNEFADTMLAQRISTISGVAQVQVFGAQKRAVRIQVDPDLLSARGIGVDEVAAAVDRANVNLPTGMLDGPRQAYTVESQGQIVDAAGYRDLVVVYREGNPIRLRELGRVIDGVEDDKSAAWYNGERSIVLAIQRQPGTNTVEVVDSIQKLLPAILAQLPASVSIVNLYDRSAGIRESVRDVSFTLWLTLGLVVLVIFLFLRNLSATIIPAVAIPLSLVGTFSVMYLLGYSLDNLSMMALTLSVGFVVDDAIVVLENIVRHIEAGQSVFQAALGGAGEIGFTVVSMTISLAAVFIPVVFMGGIVGRLLSEFAVTIGVAILVSGFVSLTLTPMLCSRVLRAQSAIHHGAIYRATEKLFDAAVAVYAAMLRWVLKHHLATIAVSGAVLVATAELYLIIPKGFLPSEDQRRIFCQTEAAEGVSYSNMIEHQQALAAIVHADPRVAGFMSSVGQRGNTATARNTGTLFMRLKPRAADDPTLDEVIQDMRRKLSSVSGVRVYLQNPPPIRIGGQLTKSLYQYSLQGPDTEELYRLAPVFVTKLAAQSGFQDVTSDLQLGNPQVRVAFDRDRMTALGVSAEQVELALGSAFGDRQISTIYAATNQYQVILEVLPESQSDTAVLPRLRIRSQSGKLIPLEAVARVTRTLGPSSVNHLGQLPAVTVSFNLAPGYSIGPALDAVEKTARETFPATVTASFQGTAQAFQSSIKNLETLLIVSVLVIYLVLGILYESYVHPLTILTALPFAGFGALFTLWWFRIDLNLFAFVGVIMLVGLVKKNGIMMVDFAVEAQRTRGLPAAEAIYQACIVRFRPIMMTTLAALAGTLPIAVGYGAGGESRRPLGLAVVGGLLFSQSLTLFVTPVFYLYAEKLLGITSRRRKRRRIQAEPGAALSELVQSGAAAIHDDPRPC